MIRTVEIFLAAAVCASIPAVRGQGAAVPGILSGIPSQWPAAG